MRSLSLSSTAGGRSKSWDCERRCPSEKELTAGSTPKGATAWRSASHDKAIAGACDLEPDFYWRTVAQAERRDGRSGQAWQRAQHQRDMERRERWPEGSSGG